MDKVDNLDFIPVPITAAAIRLGEGAGLHIATALVQRIAALRAYSNFTNGRDWIDKFSSACIVALTTRSADALLMQHIQNGIVEEPAFVCARCREQTIGLHVIRARMFPELFKLRKHANGLIHHLEKPENHGISVLNIQGIFDYCYHLFHVQNQALMGEIPNVTFELVKCKECRKVEAGSANTARREPRSGA